MNTIVAQSGAEVKTPGVVSPAQAAHIRAVAKTVKEWDSVISLSTKAGTPLSERVVKSAEDGAFLFEFEAEGGELVYGYYKAADTSQPEYALSVVNGVIVSCNCPDAMCRKQLCKHQVHLALLTDFDLRGPVTMASRLPAYPQSHQVPSARTSAGVMAGFADVARARFGMRTNCGRTTPDPAPLRNEREPRPVVSGFDPSDWR